MIYYLSKWALLHVHAYTVFIALYTHKILMSCGGCFFYVDAIYTCNVSPLRVYVCAVSVSCMHVYKFPKDRNSIYMYGVCYTL